MNTLAGTSVKNRKTENGIGFKIAKESVGMLKIEFEYADQYSNWEWRKQTCGVSSVKKCKELYGLGIDCDYRIVKVEELDK